MGLLNRENNLEVNMTKRRGTVVLLAFIVAFVVLICSIIDLQFIKQEQISEAASVKHTRTLKIQGSRGKILDVNGIPLAQDEISYNLEFYREYNLKSEREQYTNSIIFAIDLAQKYDREIATTFAISKNDMGEFFFQWGNVSDDVAQKRESKWRSDFYFADSSGLKMSPYEMYVEMRERYVIPADMNDEMAFKVLGVWQDSIQSYWSSKSITVLTNISLELATAIESYSYELNGFNVTEKTMRVYPQGMVGSHVVGYLGRITAENRQYYDEHKYDIESLVGVSGIESVMEAELTGSSGDRIGQRIVEVTSGGRILNEISYDEPHSGNNVYLTIDNNLQRVAEEALRKNIEEIKIRQLSEYNDPKNTQRYLNLVAERGGKEIKFAQVGAAVVMDVTNGDVLALVSEPNYDPNLFSQGISQEDLDAIINDEAKPLFNKAISSSDTPGSIFKLGMSLAGLEEGAITPTETIEDLGEYKKYVSGTEKGPMCGWYRDNYETHGHINVVSAINYSCNYFYYELADRLGIEKIKKWSTNLGLLDKTNIELTGESVGIVGDQKTLYDDTRDYNNQDTSLPFLVSKQVKTILEECASASGVELSDEEINRLVLRCFEMVGKTRNEIFDEVQMMLVDEYGMSKSKVRDDTRYKIYSSIVQITWTNTTTIQTGIGQSITTVTPIAVARYISALVNGGYVYDAHIVDKVTSPTGELVYEQKPTLVRKLDIKQENLDVIKRGMRDMVNESEDRYSSTARNYFDEFKYKEQLGGKTGTAQVSQINLEDNAWFVAFAPYEQPEIAIVVYIPNGRSGSMASSTVKEIAEYYLDLKYTVEDDSLPNDNSVIY